MIVLGVDPGTRNTGYGVVEVRDSDFCCHGFGSIRQSPGATYPQVLREIFEQLSLVIARHLPEAVVVEDLFYAVNVRSALKLAQTRGVVLLAAATHALPVFEYTPLEIKKGIVGFGRAEKGQIQKMVQRLLRLASAPEPHDAADALAVAICHLNQRKFRERLALAQRPK